MGRFDQELEKTRIGDPGLRRYWADVRRDLSRQWSEEWRLRRRLGIERRAEEVAERLTRPIELPHDLSELLTECRDDFTPRQFQAIVVREGFGLSLQEAADVVGVPRSTFKKRYYGGLAKVHHLQAVVVDDDDGYVGDPFPPDRVADYLWPLMQRQRRLNRRHATLNGLNTETRGTRDT
jgi:helix-turn-helix, Psq domain